MKKKEKEPVWHQEMIVRRTLYILDIINFLILTMYETYFININKDISLINNFMTSKFFTWLLWTDMILVIIFSIAMIHLARKSKKEVSIKVGFAIFSILITQISLIVFVNLFSLIFI